MKVIRRHRYYFRLDAQSNEVQQFVFNPKHFDSFGLHYRPGHGLPLLEAYQCINMMNKNQMKNGVHGRYIFFLDD